MEMNIWVCIVMLMILVYCHLLSLHLKMLNIICEDFADDHDIIFNTSKSQLLQYRSCSNNINMKLVLQM